MAARRLLGLSALVFALDQASKLLVVDAMNLAERLRIDVWPGVFTLKMGWNRGINFGLLASDSDLARWALAGLALAISAVVAIWAVRREEPLLTLGAALLIGGALGNAVDRLRWGAVADFLNVTCCGLTNPWAFNIADIAIFGGAAAIIFTPGADASASRNR
jgi:signal peptidase II